MRDFDGFRKQITEYVRKSGMNPVVEFTDDREKGLFRAYFPENGISITGNSSSNKLTVRFGSGHIAQV